MTLEELALNLEAALPETRREEWKALCQLTLHNKELAQVCLLGAFSAGKTSLINMLLGDEQLLPVGLEETTALPTLVRYADELRMELLEGEVEPRIISIEEAREFARTPSLERRILSLYVPQPWLRHAILVDLPGTSSMSPVRRAVTRAFIRDSDLVLYTLEPRGPTATDLELLREMHQMGKRLRLLVTRWDQVEQVATQDTRPVSLTRWEQDIKDHLGVSVELIPTSARTQRGKEELTNLLSRVGVELKGIRENRFRAEASAFVREAILRYDEELEIVAQTSSARQEELVVQLRGKREELLALKRSLFAEHHQERGAVEHLLGQHNADALDIIRGRVNTLQAKLFHDRPDPDAWTCFLQEGREICQRQIESSALELSNLLIARGLKVSIEQPRLDALNLALPALPALSSGDFLEEGRIHHIEETLRDCERQASELELTTDPQAVASEHDALQTHLTELADAIQETQQRPIEMLQEVREGSKLGSQMGRIIGEVVDIATVLVPGPAQLTVMLKLFGGGAKALKVAQAIAAKPIKLARSGVLALRKGRHTVFKELGLHKMQGPGGHSIFDWLDVFSFGFVLEKIAGTLDGESEVIDYPDPDQIRARDEQLQRLQKDRDALNAQLEKILKDIDEAESNEVRRRELERLRERHEQRIEQLRAEAERRYESELKRAHELWIQRIGNLTDQARGHWDSLFQRHFDGMVRTFLRHLDDHLEHNIRQRLDEHEAFLKTLQKRLGQTDNERAQRETVIQKRRQTLLDLKVQLGDRP